MRSQTKAKTLPNPLYLAVFSALFLALMAFMTARANAATTIVSFGDSLSAGYQLAKGKSFSDQLAAKLKAEGLDISMTNAAVSGDTTSTGLARLDWSIPDGTDLVILELGANDALQGLSVEQAHKNLAAMITRLQERKINVLLVGMKAPPNMGKDYVDQFDAIYPKLAQDHNVPLYPFFLEGVAAQPELNLKDGIHPNEKGLAIIVEGIAPLVTKIVKQIQSQ